MPELQPTLPLPAAAPLPGGDTVAEGNTTPGHSDPNRTTSYLTSDIPVSSPTIPGFIIEAELGRGGMGVVYRARQVGLDRPVALKMILRADYAGTEQKLRFQIEAENAARVRHPNIVQVYEIGAHQDQPYFALEFVEGGSLSDWLNSHRATPAEAARLVETLARAMHAAHVQGIIHRDLKPANVLLAVSSSPLPVASPEINAASPATGRCQLTHAVPKIADFGLAKRLDATDHLTGSGAVMGTPSYMSPEQARGDTKHVGPAADQYALGVIFYQLLTHRLPFEAVSVPALLKKIVEEEPAAPRARNPQVPLDLSIICLKCLEKDPAKRYATTEALAEDLKNWREHRPIAARPATRLERVTKWCRRYPAVAALIVVSVLAALIASGLAWWAVAEKGRAETAEQKERERANSEQFAKEKARAMSAKALQALRSMTDRGMELQLARGKFTREDRAFLQDVLEQYQALAVAEDEALQAEGLGRVAMLQARLGDVGAATTSCREALARYRKLAAERPAEFELSRQLNIVLTNLANLLMQHGSAKEAEELHRESLAKRRELAARHPSLPDARADVAQGCLSLTGLLARQGRFPEAESLAAEAIAKWRQEVAAQPEQREALQHLADALQIYAHLLMIQSKHAAARPAFAECIVHWQRLLAKDPKDSKIREGLAAALLNFGSMFMEQDKKTDAIPLLQQAVEIYRELAADFPAVPEYRRHLAGARNNLAVCYRITGKAKEAEAEQLIALEASRRAAEEFADSPELQTDFGGACVNYALLLLEQGRLEEAERHALQGHEVLSKSIQRFPEYALAKAFHQRACLTLKNAHAHRGKAAQAKSDHASAVAAFEKAMALASGAERVRLNWSRVFSLVHLQPTLALAEAEALRQASPSEIADLELARLHSLALPRLEAAARHGAINRAIQLLEGLRDSGFFRKNGDAAGPLCEDEQLKELRAQPQFRAAFPELFDTKRPPRPPAR